MTSAAELTAIAVDVARDAAALIRTRRGDLIEHAAAPMHSSAVSTKSTPTDPVTVVDTEAEAAIRAHLHRLRPDDAFLGEEDGGSLEVPSGVRWVVDPIDGTVNFLYGIPAYSVSIAAQIDGVSVAGAVVDVARSIVYSATRGGGAVRDDGTGPHPLRANAVSSVSLALVATGFGYGADRRRAQGRVIAELLPRIRDIRRVGSAALDLCMVASGAVDAHFEHGLNPWDWAAGALIAEEAGAVVRTPGPQSRGGEGPVTIAVAPGIATEFLALLDEIGASGPIS
ncbi:inositol monophosphatase family protein [Williamsia herbipolensis]|uniref:Inositol-1-monophosphatase n=1 Tax=Williamsia herbipolensis TaxID=1603258 RepID=A0AAU4K3C2_9NOCA|nr:inositol monophosphatase family protein [Williamsia herbipolensis]MCX6470933.1 inositol monophosphatase family protein [Mycobacteriales bacterium]